MIEPTTTEIAIRGHSREVRLKEHYERDGRWIIEQAYELSVVFPSREAAEAQGQRLILALDEVADLERRAGDIKAAAYARVKDAGLAQ